VLFFTRSPAEGGGKGEKGNKREKRGGKEKGDASVFFINKGGQPRKKGEGKKTGTGRRSRHHGGPREEREKKKKERPDFEGLPRGKKKKGKRNVEKKKRPG